MSGNLQPKGQQSVIFIQSRPLIDLQPIGCLDFLAYFGPHSLTNTQIGNIGIICHCGLLSGKPHHAQNWAKIRSNSKSDSICRCCRSAVTPSASAKPINPEVEMMRCLAALKVKGSPGAKLVQHFLFTKFATDPIAHHFLQD